jgi:glutamate racemase
MSSLAPIGVFDSGVGGLTVFRAIERAMPGRSLIYLGDTARVPYGTRSPEAVIRYSLEAGAFMRSQGVETLIVGCNTASAVALDALRAETDLDILGVIEPGARRAVERSESKNIGVIGTRATIHSDAYGKAIRRLAPEATVLSEACPLFVPLAEEGWIENDVAYGVAFTYLQSMIESAVDTLVLGCTHYPLLRGVIGATVGWEVELVDSAEAVAMELSRRIGSPEPVAGQQAEHQFFVTDLPAPFRAVAERFLGRPLERLEQARIDLI